MQSFTFFTSEAAAWQRGRGGGAVGLWPHIRAVPRSAEAGARAESSHRFHEYLPAVSVYQRHGTSVFTISVTSSVTISVMVMKCNNQCISMATSCGKIQHAVLALEASCVSELGSSSAPWRTAGRCAGRPHPLSGGSPCEPLPAEEL